MSKAVRLLALAGAVTLSACAEIKFSLPPYTPTTTEELEGQMSVDTFGYFPKEGIQQNEIRETAAGRILLTEPVGEYFANAVRRELRQAGMSLKEGGCSLNGEVNDFATDSLGYSTDYITDVRYIVRDSNENVLYDNTHQVKFNTSKFVVADVIFANINKVVSDNIKLMLGDETFQSVVKEKCNRL